MKRSSILLLGIASLASAQSLRVGAAEVVISPPAGTPMAGYYSTRLSTGVHDDLHAKAIVIASGEQRVALVACDLVGIPPAVVEEARTAIEKATGIPGGNVMISATHSHTGPLIPDGGARAGAYGGDLPDCEALPRGTARAKSRRASASPTPGSRPRSVSFGKGREDGVSFNRRFFMKDGTVGWNPGKLNPNIVRPAGPIDPDVPVVLFESAAGEPLASYVNFAMHQDTVGGLEASADYAYTLSTILAKVKGHGHGHPVHHRRGGQHQSHRREERGDPQQGHAEAARIGTILAGEVLKTYARLEPVAPAELQVTRRTVSLDPARLEPGDEERARAFAKQLDSGATVKFLDTVFAFKALDTAARHGKPLDAEVQVIALGDQIAWVGLPGEIFTELGSGDQADLALSADDRRGTRARSGDVLPERRRVSAGQLRGRHVAARRAARARSWWQPRRNC